MTTTTHKAAAAATGQGLSQPAPFPVRYQEGRWSFLEPWRFQRDKLGYITRACHADPVVRIRVGPVWLYMLREPEHVQHVLLETGRTYDKQTVGFDALRVFLGEGLLTSEGDFWRRQRRIAQPAFHRDRISGFATIMVDLADETLDAWESAARAERPVDVVHEMMELTQRIAGMTLLGMDPAGHADEVGRAVDVLNRHVDYLIMTPIRPPAWVPTRRHRQARWSLRTMDRIVGDIIRQRRSAPEPGDDLLAMLMEARDEETGEGMTDRQLRDEVLTMFVAGHETTSNALSWTFYLLSQHPGVTEKCRAEVQEVLGGRRPEAADVRQLTYLERVVKESMRLYPPAWFIERNVCQDDVIGGKRVEEGAIVGIAPWVTHRLEHLWPDPDRFDPDRFSPEASKGRPRFAYFPFGGGQRLCIGKPFAMMEAVLILARALQRYDLRLVPGFPVEPEALVTLRPKHGLQMVPSLR